MNLLYPANFKPQPDRGFTVLFVDLPEAITEGDTFDEAMLHAQEVLSLSLRGRIEDGQPIPLPSAAKKGKQVRLVAPDALAQSAVLLRLARGDRPLSDLARAMETSWAAAQRLEDPHHWPSLKQLDRAAKVLGKRLVLSLE
jgi:antitoxin HicB